MSLMERIRGLGALLGTAFSGMRDYYVTFGYSRRVGYQELLGKYLRQDLASRIVEAEPHATWSAPPTLETSNKEFMTIWEDIVTELNLFSKFARLDKLVGIGEYALLVVGFDDGQELKAPVKSRPGRKIIYMTPYSVETAKISEYEIDPRNPRYGKPKMYRITPRMQERSLSSAQQAQFNPMPFEVHHSRVLHVAENCLEDDSFGIPRLMRVYNLMDDLLKTAGGSAETFWLTSNRGMQIDVDKEMDLKPQDAQDLSDEVDEYFHNLRRVIRTKGVKINNLGSDVADPRGTFQVLISLISGATGIPQRILIGSEAGQLASAQDRANWATRIEERRNLFAEPAILKEFVMLVTAAGVLPKVTDLSYKWPDAFRQNPLERAQTSAQQARSLANVSKALSDDVPVVTPGEGRQIIGLKGDAPEFKNPVNDHGKPNDPGAPGDPGNPTGADEVTTEPGGSSTSGSGSGPESRSGNTNAEV